MKDESENLWHYSDGTSTYGPLGSSVIRQLITVGTIRPDFTLRRDGGSSWHKADGLDLDAPLEPESPTAPPLTPPAATSAYHLTRNGETRGPLQVDELKAMLNRREITDSDLVWKDGMSGWTAIAKIDELRTLPDTPPPPPPLAVSSPSNDTIFLAFMRVLKKYAVFEGRADRMEFWGFSLTGFLISLLLLILEGPGGMLGSLYQLAVFVPAIAVGIRRMHDVNASGWYLLLPIVNLVYLCEKGTPGSNRYGVSPAA